MSYQKTIAVGYAPGAEYGYAERTKLPVEVEVEIRDREQGPELSICGSIWQPRRGDIIAGGQNLEEIAELFPNDPKVQRIVEVWRAWHLNGMKAGCEHQRAEGWDKRPIDPLKPTNTYGFHFAGQKHESWNLLGWVRPDEHSDGLLTRPCPVCGYRYGTKWMYEPLPQEIIDEVKGW